LFKTPPLTQYLDRIKTGFTGFFCCGLKPIPRHQKIFSHKDTKPLHTPDSDFVLANREHKEKNIFLFLKTAGTPQTFFVISNQ